MASIRENLTDWAFGLLDEIPDDAKIAWGARAIANKDGSFGLIHNRCNFLGDESLRGEFEQHLNRAIARGQDTCKRLRMGWNPIKDLKSDDFSDYFNGRISEDAELEGTSLKMGLSGGSLSGVDVYFEIKKEQALLAKYYHDTEDSYDNVPDPPARCEGHEDEYEGEDLESEPCTQRFLKSGNGWDGCTLIDDSWECDNCGYQHFFEVDCPKPPESPWFDAFSKIAGYQYPKMSDNAAETFVLYQDDRIVFKGNTNASFGYIYLVAYPK